MLRERYNGRNSSLSLAVPPATARAFITSHFKVKERPRTVDMRPRQPRPKTNSDPICDMDIPDTLFRSSYQGKDLELRKLAPLPPFTSDQFAAELIVKLKQCQVRCNFDYLDADRDAKVQKTTDLNDVLKALSVPANVRKFTPGMVRSIIQMTTSNICRSVIRLDRKLIVMDEITPLRDPVMEHVLIVYQILNRLLHCLPGNQLFSLKLLRTVLSQAFSPDEKEREQVVVFAVEYFKVNVDKAKEFFNILGDVLETDKQSVNGAFAATVVLTILHKLLADWATIPKQVMVFFTRFVLPMLARPNFVFFKTQMTAVVTEFVTKGKQAVAVLGALMRYWPQTRNVKNAAFLRLSTLVIARMYQKEVAPLICPMIRKFADGALSMSEKVAESAIQNISDPILKQFLIENTRAIFEIIVPALKMTSELHWSMKIRDLAKMGLAYMSRLCTRTYKEVVKLNGAVPGKPNEVIRHQWANIVRVAGQRDASINTGKKLSEVARAFSAARNAHGVELAALRRGSVACPIPSRNSLPALQPQGSSPRLQVIKL